METRSYLIAPAPGSLRERLGVEQINLWQLHRIDPLLPRDEQFGAVRKLLDDGIIRHAGLSEVSVARHRGGARVFPMATVQNRYNLVDRSSEDVLAYCAANNVGFIPSLPLASGDLAKSGSLLDNIARHHGAAPGQIALAWMLKRSPVMLPIPGTSQVSHLEENVAGRPAADGRGIQLLGCRGKKPVAAALSRNFRPPQAIIPHHKILGNQ